MSFRLCLLNHMRVDLHLAGERSVFNIDTDGLETGEPVVRGKSDKVRRSYVCTNCGQEYEGAESFDEARGHLGKPHDLIDPFIIKEVVPEGTTRAIGGSH